MIEKQRLHYLDGLRGIGAVLVMMRHTGDYWEFAFHRSYLAVDIFFLLSGYVIAFSYEKPLRSGLLTPLDFIKIRLIRLYPTFIVSVVAAALVMPLATPIDQLLSSTFWLHWGQSLITTPLLIPDGRHPDENQFLMNLVYWTLLLELLVNVLYAYSARWLTNSVLLLIVVLFGLGTAAFAIANNGLNIGWLAQPFHLFGGSTRAIFAIVVGIFLFRHRDRLLIISNNMLSGVFALLLIVLILMSPDFGTANAAIDIVSVTILIPAILLVLVGARLVLWPSAMNYLSAASYPLYLFHVPVTLLLLMIARVLGAPVNAFAPWSGMLMLCLLLPLAEYYERKFDLPFRRKLMARYLTKLPERAPVLI